MAASLSPALYALCRQVLRCTWERFNPIRVQGLEHLPLKGPAIICPKHQRWEDILVVGLALPPPLHYIAKVELFKTPGQREFLQALGGVPLDRDSPRATLSSFRQMAPLLQTGAFLVLFPEGTYFRGRVGPGKHRLIQMLLRLQNRNGLSLLPFVPVGLAYRRNRLGLDIEVKVGAPLSVSRADQAPELTRVLMLEIARLSGA